MKIYIVLAKEPCDNPFCGGTFIPNPLKAYTSREATEKHAASLPFKAWVEELELEE